MAANEPYVHGILELGVGIKANALMLGTRSGRVPSGFWAHFGEHFERRALEVFNADPVHGVVAARFIVR